MAACVPAWYYARCELAGFVACPVYEILVFNPKTKTNRKWLKKANITSSVFRPDVC